MAKFCSVRVILPPQYHFETPSARLHFLHNWEFISGKNLDNAHVDRVLRAVRSLQQTNNISKLVSAGRKTWKIGIKWEHFLNRTGSQFPCLDEDSRKKFYNSKCPAPLARRSRHVCSVVVSGILHNYTTLGLAAGPGIKSLTWVSPVSSLLYCMMPIYPSSMTALPRDKSPVRGSGLDWSLGLDPVKPAEAVQARGEISLNETESEEVWPAPAKTGDPTATGLVPSFLHYSQHSTEPQKIQVTRATENRNGILSGLPPGPRPSSLSSLAQ